jgi:prepilin-type N-terminal cleavage/methylation domain-containing protein
MRFVRYRPSGYRQPARGFTLAEVVVAIAIATLAFGGVIYGYVLTSDRAEWSANSLAAQSLAMQGIEQARSEKWDPKAWPAVDELGVTNYTQVDTLDVPRSGQPILATNYISVTFVSQDPPLRQLRADCVWSLVNGKRSRGPFTNTAITLRTADQ